MHIGNCSFSENFVHVQMNDPFEIYWTGNKRIIGEFVLLRFIISSLLRFSGTINLILHNTLLQDFDFLQDFGYLDEYLNAGWHLFFLNRFYDKMDKGQR